MKKSLITVVMLLAALLQGYTLRAQLRICRTLLPPALRIQAEAETEKYVWFGTDKGLFMVKKKNKKVFHLTTENSALPDNYVTAIAVKPNGEVYVGTRNGLLRYDNYAFLRMDTENSALPSNVISDLFTDSLGRIVVETLGQGRFIIPDGSSGYYIEGGGEKLSSGQCGNLHHRE